MYLKHIFNVFQTAFCPLIHVQYINNKIFNTSIYEHVEAKIQMH